MRELDLVPAGYRRRRALRRAVLRLGVVYAVALAVFLGAKVSLALGIERESAAIDRLRTDQDAVLRRRALLAEAAARRARLLERLEVLERLRGGAPVHRVFRGVDAALDGTVWFLDWRFRRAGELVEAPRKPVETGYLLVLPGEGGDASPARAWRLRTHMEIRAQALDHSALARFVSALARDPLVEDVRVIRTSTRRYTTAEVVDFELAVVLDSGAASPG